MPQSPTDALSQRESRPRPPPPPHQAVSRADMGRGSREGPGKGGVGALPECPLSTFNLGTRCSGMRQALRPAAARLLCARGGQKSQGSSPRLTPAARARRQPRLRHPVGARTPPLRGSCRRSSGRDRGGGKERGREEQGRRRAGGEEREIRLLGLLIWVAVQGRRGGQLRRLPDADKAREKAGGGGGSAAAPTLPWRSHCGSPGRPPLPAPTAAPRCPPQRLFSGRSLQAPPATHAGTCRGR